jgi:NhaP-type Na+/H+ or K+/H+ antiporter
VAAAFSQRRVLRYRIRPLLAHVQDPGSVTHVWHMLEYIGNTLIFALAGLVIGFNMASRWGYLGWMDVVSACALRFDER